METSHKDFFQNKLGLIGANALDKLCGLGCKRSTLAELFGWLAGYKVQTIISTVRALNPVEGDPGEKKVEVRIDLRALDSRSRAHPGISLVEIDKIARRAQRLKQDVIKLRKTALVEFLVDQEIIAEGDLLAGSPFHLFNSSRPFDGLLRLPELTRQCGEQKKPQQTRIQKEIHRYIHKETGSWNDSLFAAIQNELFPRDKHSEKDVQRWRKRHGVMSSPPSSKNVE